MMETAFAYKNTKEILERSSSSGGAYMGLVSSFQKNCGGTEWAVYGAKFDDDFNIST